MSRLTERSKDDRKKALCCTNAVCAIQCGECEHMDKMMEKLADYEDKQEQGLLIELPVAIGGFVYRINKFSEEKIIPMMVKSLEIKGSTNTLKVLRCMELEFLGEVFCEFTDIGNTVYLTRSEAEEALAKMGGK